MLLSNLLEQLGNAESAWVATLLADNLTTLTSAA